MIAKSDNPALSTAKPEGLREDGDGSPYRILVVDDSMFVAKQMTQILNSEGYEVIGQAADGAIAVEMYKGMHPRVDLVTMDITMPNMDGLTALQKILEFDKNARIIMISALGKQDVVKQALLSGAKNYIVKPIDRKKVLERIHYVLTE
jgi:two-component system chemotaxis response regulator CheY